MISVYNIIVLCYRIYDFRIFQCQVYILLFNKIQIFDQSLNSTKNKRSDINPDFIQSNALVSLYLDYKLVLLNGQWQNWAHFNQDFIQNY